MWTYTIYIIYTYIQHERPGQDYEGTMHIAVKNFVNFVFNIIWTEHRIAFHDSEEDLKKDLKLLSRFGIIDYSNEVITITSSQLSTLEGIGQAFKNDPMRTRMPIVNE